MGGRARDIGQGTDLRQSTVIIGNLAGPCDAVFLGRYHELSPR